MLRKRSWIYALSGLAAVVAAAGAWWWLGAKNGPARAFETVDIERGAIERSVATSGAVRPLVTVDVGAQLSGQIEALYADYNSTVKEGDLIALIDPKTYETRVRQAEADLVVARANIDVQSANVGRAEASLRQSERNLARQKELFERGNVSEAALDIAETSHESALAELETAKAQKRNAEANLRQREAQLESARIDLERTRIVSPIDGTVIERNVSVGQTMAASFTTPVLFKIAQDLTEIQIEASVDEADIGGIKEGDPATFTVDAYPDRTFRGEVKQVRIAPVELQNVVTYVVIVTASNRGRALLPGMTANVEIVTGKRDGVLRVRSDALRFRPPAEWTAGGAAGGGRQGAPGGGMAGGFGGDPLSRLPFPLTAEQQTAIRAEMQKIFASMRERAAGSGFGPNFSDPETMRAQMQAQIERVMERHLTDEQFKNYQSFAAKLAEVKMGVLWVVGADGAPEPRPVRLGISDERYVEILDGAVKEGEKAVSRIVKDRP